MTQYLLAADADKIQNLLFRASHLREVVGGSQLLARFCHKMPGILGLGKEQVIVGDGGRFTLLFDNEQEAKDFGEKLAEMYRQVMGGTLTVAPPVQVNEPIEEHFSSAHKKVGENLRQAKQHRAGSATAPHLPYMAFCASCGVGLAVEHSQRHEERPQFLCADCRHKVDERDTSGQDVLVTPFLKQVVGNPAGLDCPYEAEQVASYDPRRYVAYLVADGNGMGMVFSQCATPTELRQLSAGLTPAMRKSLAEPTRILWDNQPRRMANRVPVLPLILAGDDLFALLPAPWALDFARRLALVYEREAGNAVKDFEGVDQPTLTAAVVICKASYPYYLAHERGEKLMREAKRISKQRAADTGNSPRSMITFDVILGSSLTPEGEKGPFRPTLGPYWIGENVPEWGLAVDRLIEQRHKLRHLPHKRLAQLRSHYGKLKGLKHQEEVNDWVKELDKILDRVAHSPSLKRTLEETLGALGGKGLYEVNRSTERDIWYGHALPDLLDAWDFCYDLEKSWVDYEE